MEATAEEANRKLQLNLHDKVGAGGKAPPPSQAELEAFGLTQEFADWVRTLNYRWAHKGVVGPLLLLAGCLLHVSVVLLAAMHIAGRLHSIALLYPPSLLCAVRSASSQLTTCCRRAAQQGMRRQAAAALGSTSSTPGRCGAGQLVCMWVLLNMVVGLRCTECHALTVAAIASRAASALPRFNEHASRSMQVRHATLVVQALKEVNELRFVLCPK